MSSWILWLGKALLVIGGIRRDLNTCSRPICDVLLLPECYRRLAAETRGKPLSPHQVKMQQIGSETPNRNPPELLVIHTSHIHTLFRYRRQHYVQLVGPARCFIFIPTLFCESYMVVDVAVQNPQKSNVYEYEKKHVRSVGVYSGIMYGCVRYVLRVARVDSGWGFRILFVAS